jgi:hypothetical protein
VFEKEKREFAAGPKKGTDKTATHKNLTTDLKLSEQNKHTLFFLQLVGPSFDGLFEIINPPIVKINTCKKRSPSASYFTAGHDFEDQKIHER